MRIGIDFGGTKIEVIAIHDHDIGARAARTNRLRGRSSTSALFFRMQKAVQQVTSWLRVTIILVRRVSTLESSNNSNTQD